MSKPLISIITPSFNQGQYLEQTILSVIGQNYSNFEYIIIDGQSTDNSVEIIKKYDQYIRYWVSEPDKGQSDAINKGFNVARGDIFCWLNSDDMLLPGVFNLISGKINVKKNQMIFGNCIHLRNDADFHWGSDAVHSHGKFDLRLGDYLKQPSTFWTRIAWETTGELNENLHYTFDWEWFIRSMEAGTEFIPYDEYFSIYRIHSDHKSGSGGKARNNEILHIYENYSSWEISKLARSLLNRKNLIWKISKILKLLKLESLEKPVVSLLYPFLVARYGYKNVLFVGNMLP